MGAEIVTVFTPTYNRGYLLSRLYESLCRQTNQDFIWLIVDDGSEDDTGVQVEQWKLSASFKIEYLYQPNGGKHRAHNRGVMEARTELFLICDSDDYLVDDAIESVVSLWNNGFTSNIAGMIAYKGECENMVLGGKEFPPNKGVEKIWDLMGKGDAIFDTVQIYKTNVLKKYLFPEIEGEKFCTEMLVWMQIDEKYDLLVFPKIIEIAEYRKDGLTRSGLNHPENSPVSSLLYAYQSYLRVESFLKKICCVGRYNYYALAAIRKNRITYCQEIRGGGDTYTSSCQGARVSCHLPVMV